MEQDVVKVALIIKKCKELLGGADIAVENGKTWEVEVKYNEQGEGQTIYFIRSLGPVPTDGKRGYSARLIIPPDGKFFAEWNRFKDEDEILGFLNQ